ncbi:hypothetical protein J3E69DRAFT_355893 [Trichoderma sp. SZMC 28015]
MPHPRRRSPESSRRRRREKRLSREEKDSLYSSPNSITPQQMPGSYSADSPQQQQPYQPPPQSQFQQQPQFQQPQQPPLPLQQQAFPSPPQQQYPYPQHYQQMSLPMPQHHTPSQDAAQPRSRASSGSLSSSPSSSSSSYTEITRVYPTSRFGNFISTFVKAPGSGTKKRRGVFFGGGSNSSHSSINSDMAYGTGFVKKEKDRSTRYSSSQQQQQYPPAAATRPSPKLLNEGKRNKTDEEILAIGRQLSDLARRSNEEDLRAAGKTRPALRKSRKEAKKRGLAGSKKHRASSSDESDWESASDDDGDSSESSSSDDSTSALAYGGDSSRSNVALSGLMGAAAGAATGAVASSSSVVDPRLFGPVNSLHEQPPPASMSSNRYDNDRPATGESQADSTHRPGPIPLQQPIPMVPVSNKVFEAGRRDSRNSYRRQLSNTAAAAAAAAMADQRGPWTEDQEDYFQRDQAPFEELERRRANPEVYYNRRNDNDSPRLESDRQVPDYAKDSSNLPRDSRSWMELHPEERKETLKYQTTYDAHMRDTERQLREDKLREAQRQQQQQQQPPQPARAIKAGDRNIETTAQPVPKPLIDPFQYQVANDAFNTPQFNTPRRGRTPEIVTVDRVPNFANPSPAPASAPPPSQMPLRPQSNADIRLSRKDSYEIERAAEERRRGGESESRSRDPRGGYEYEQEEKDARSILDEAKHSTIPVAAVAIASAIAVEEERSRERKRREYSDDGSRDRNRPAKDAVQEDADRYYRESVIARKIASDEIRSRSHSPDESVVDKWEKPSAEESFSIVAPPSMEDREHDDDENNPYAPPNADVRIDNEIFPHETDRFRATNGLGAAKFTSRDASCERERPLLNIVRPTPVPSPDSTSVGLKQPAEVPASREIEKEEESIASSEDEESDPKGEATHSSPSGKSVTWGENSTKRFVVESPESRSRAESPNELAETEDKPRPRLSKISQWGKIAAMMAAGTAEPTTELDRHTASRSRDLPADDDVNGAPPVPGPKPASPEPEQMPGTFSDDLEFTATVAAGLEKSGFDPNIVIDDPDFRRRGSRPETSEVPVMGHAETERSAEEPLPASEDDLAKDREVVADEEELSLADTEESEDEKTQKQRKLNALEKYLQMRQSGEIKPPSQPAEPVETPAIVERPITPPQNNERRNMLEKFLQRRQSGEIQPPREMRQSNQTEEPETTEAVPRHEPEAEQPPTRTPLHPEALAQLDDSASDFAPSKSKKKKKKKRRDRLDDERSGLSIPGDEGTEISRISVPGDEATVFSVEDWEDWDSSPRSTRRSIVGSMVASELSTSSRRSTRPKRRSGTEKDLREVDGNEPPPYSRDGPTDQDDERRPRSRESKSSQYNDNSEKPISSRKRKDSSGKKSGFLSGIFNKSGGKETINEKGDSFFEQAGILGAGAGLASLAASAATALTRSNAADVSSDPENISRDLPGSSREDDDIYPVIAPRAIAIDPQYGDLLPLPPSEPGTPLDASLDKLPGLPDSRPGTPDEDRARRFEKTHRRQRSNQESSRNRSHSNTAVPLALLRGIGSSPSSPVMAFKPPRTPPRPTSWDSTKEFMPLMLLEHARRGSADLKGEELPPLPPSEVSSEAEGGAMSDREEDRLSSALRLRPEDFRSPMPPNDGFSSTDHQLRLQTDIPTMGRSVSDEGSEGSTPKADLTYELPVPPTNNTLGDYDAPAPVESTPSSGQSARTVDAQAIPSPTTPTRRFLSPNKDIRHHAEELTSADASDDFETARTSPADINDDDELFEPPPIEPSMLGAIPEFSRPAKFWEDKVPEHSEPTSVDKVIETLPSVKNVPKDQARQGSPSYLDPLLESAEESSTKVLAKEPALDADRGFSDEYTSIKERKALPVMVEDESEPEPEQPVAVFEPLDEVVEAPYTETVDIVPVSEELSYDAITESAQHSDSEEVEEIVIAEPVLEEPEPPEASPIIEDSEESEEEEETEEEDDSEDSEESEEDSEEEEEHAVADVGKHVGEDGHAVRDMTASKKSKKKKKKKKKKRKRKKKTKAAAAAAAAAAAVAATEASHDTPIQHAKESTEALPAEFDRNDSEPITQPGPVDAEPVSEAPEQFTREIAEEPMIEKAQEVAASPEFTPREGLEPVSEPTPLAETEEPQTLPSTAVESTNNDADGLEDELLKWANTDSEPIPHSDHAKTDEADTLAPELSDEQDDEKRSIQVEDEAIAVEEKPETLAPLQEEVSAPVDAESDPVSTDEVPADLPAKGEDYDSADKDREVMVTDEVEPAVEETPIESPAVAEEHLDADVTDSLASDADELASIPREESPSADREWEAAPEYEDTMLPTIMEESGFEEGEDEFDQDAPFSDQLSPILEESLEDLMEDSAPEKTSDQESIEPTLETIPEESAWSIGRAEDQPEQQTAEETRYLEHIGEESDATAVVEDISLEPQMDESVPRSLGGIAETTDNKPLDWAPPQLPSFASDISEPLFTQGDAPSEYPTQQSPAGYEPTQMDEIFAVPEEPSRSPPPVPDTADEGDSKAIEPEYSEVPVVPEEPSRTPPPVPNAEYEGDSKADEFESPEAVVIPEEPSRPPPSIPGATNEGESLDAVEAPEEPSRPPPPVPSAADEDDSKAAELEPLEGLVESEADVPALEHQDKLEENIADLTDAADIAPSVEERELVDEQLSTAAPDATIQEPELKEVDPPAEGDNEERQETSVSLDLEPTKQEEQELVASDSAPPMESIIAQFPALQEEYKAQDDMAIEQPSGQDLNLDVTPQEDQSTLDAELPEPHDEDHEAKDVEPVSQQEPETIPLQEADRELDLEPKAEQEAANDGLQPPMNNTDLENEGSGDISREVDVDTTKSDTHLETGISEDARPIHEEEHGPEMENNDTENLDAEKGEEKTENPEQSVELDSTGTLDPSVENNFPQEPNMTSELEQPTLEAEIVAPPTTPPNAEEKVESEYPPQTEDSEQMNLAQDDAIAPVSTEHQDPSAEVEPATEVELQTEEPLVPQEAELQTEEPLAPQEAQPPTEKEINEPENERQGSAVAEGLDQFEAPAEIIKEDSIDTTLPGSDTVTDANDASRLDNDNAVVDEARSDPTDVVDSGISEETRDVMPAVEDKEAAGDDLVQEGTSEDQVAHDVQLEVPSTMTDALAEDEPKLEEAQPELKPEELPLEQISDEHQQEPKSDEPEPESIVEEANRGLDLASEEFRREPKLEENPQVPAVEELQQEPVSEIQEPKLEEPHHDSSDDESEHESQSKELEPSTTDSQLQDVDEATAKKIAKKERKKARRRARAAAAAVEEAVVDPVAWKDDAQYQSATEEIYNSHPLDSTERDVPVDNVAADSEQLPPAEAISLPTEEPMSTEPVDQPESEAALPTEPQEETSKPTEEPQEKPFVPDSPEVRQSRTWETDKSRKNSSMFLSIPGAADSSGSEEDSDDDASEAGSFRFGGPNDSSTRLTGFEVTATPRGEQHAHRDRHRKKKKKKGGKKHKRKKSRSGGSERGSDPSSSLPSLPTTSNPNLAGSVPNLNDSQPSVSDELVNKEQKPSSNVGEDGAAEPPATGAGGSRNIDELLSEFADDPEVMDPPQSQRVGSITAPLDTIPEDASGEDVGSPRLKEPMSLPDNKDSETSRPSGEQIDSAPQEEEPENAWDMFTGNWGKSSGKRSESDLTRSLELAPDERPPQDLLDRKQAHMIQDAPLVDEPAEISTPQRRNSQTDNTASDELAGSELQVEKRPSSFSGTQSPKGNDPKSMRPGSASSQGSNQWLGFLSERFGPKKKKTRDRDKDPIGEDDKEDPNEESFLGNPALRKSGDERSWETKIETLDDFLQRSGSPTTPKKRKRRQQSDTPTTPKRTESIVEARDDGDAVERRLKRGDVFGGQLVDSPILEAMEVLGPFELLKRNAQVEDPIGGLLREASEISVLPPMDMMSEISDYDLSDYRLSPRGLPSVEELPEAEAEATASEVGYYRDSSFSGSPPSRSRRHSTSTIPIEDNEEKLRDGIDADWLEAAMKQLKTPEPMNRTPERQPQRRLRRSTLGGQKLREPTSLREAAKDPEKKTIPGTRERVLTGTGTRPETPTGRSSPTRKGYGAITGMGFGRLANGRVSPMPASSVSERSDTPPVLKRSVTSPVTSAPLRSLRRAVSAQIGPGLQRPESPSVPLMPAATEQPRSVSDSKIPSATGRQTGDEARADPGRGRGTPNSGLVRQRTPERLKFSQQDGSTVRSSSNPTPPLLRRAERRFSLRQPNSSTSSIAPNPIPSPMPASTNPSPIPTPTPFSTSTPKPELATAPKLTSEAPVANEGRVRAKDKPDVYDGFGEGRIGSPLSPTRPHSMRRRQSMQVLELEARVEQLIAENRLLSDARHSTDQHLSHRVVTALSDRDTQIESLKQTLKFLRGEVSRLTEVNDGLSSANAELANKDNSRYADLQVHADRGENQDALMQALRDKDAQIASLTAKLDAAKEKIRELQRQILESQAADVQFLSIKDEDYFDHRCQQLCSHVQQWVLRFSKFSDMRACRLTSEINDEKIIDRLDNAVLDGSDVDRYLNDRVRRRDIFMSMTMNMIWEFVFTRYLFGMDREQRQKLKSLEKLLTEVGPPQAVRQWRAVTLTLLSKRDSFKRQRDLDTEAVVQAIYQTLCKVLPPPSNLEAQIQAQLRRVMHEAVHLSIEMRTQKAEYMMLPPLQPEYDADGELVQTVQFNASMMNERSPSSLKLTNEELEARGAIVRVVLFPLVVKKGDDDGSNDEEIVVHPAQVLIARSKLTRQPTPSDGGRVSVGTGRLSGGTNSPSTRTSDVI